MGKATRTTPCFNNTTWRKNDRGTKVRKYKSVIRPEMLQKIEMRILKRITVKIFMDRRILKLYQWKGSNF